MSSILSDSNNDTYTRNLTHYLIIEYDELHFVTIESAVLWKLVLVVQP